MTIEDLDYYINVVDKNASAVLNALTTNSERSSVGKMLSNVPTENRL